MLDAIALIIALTMTSTLAGKKSGELARRISKGRNN
jgi:hypothetical protein